MPTSPDKACPTKCEKLLKDVKTAPNKNIFMRDNMTEMQECVQLCAPPESKKKKY